MQNVIMAPAICSTVLIALLLAPRPVWAEQGGAEGAGRAAARGLCAECHAIERGEVRSPARSAPPFAEIAAVPGMTSAALRASLGTSHRTMPNIILTPDQLGDIVAYILSLKPSR
jgi:mono/diheme cytochrome c family protein